LFLQNNKSVTLRFFDVTFKNVKRNPSVRIMTSLTFSTWMNCGLAAAFDCLMTGGGGSVREH